MNGLNAWDEKTVEERCIEIVAKAKLLAAANVTRAMSFDELQIDSLDKINISFEVEDAFHIQIPDESISSLKTVGDMIDGVMRLLAAELAAGILQSET